MLPPTCPRSFLRRTDVRIGGESLAEEYVYRPGELLVHPSVAAELADPLAGWGCVPADDGGLRYDVPTPLSVPTLVRRLREQLPGREHQVGPNHVFGGLSRVGWAVDHPVATTESFDPPVGGPANGPVVGVVDTGFALDAGAPHPWLGGRIDGPVEEDQLDHDSDGLLDELDGHGTFVAGLILREAPTARIRMRAILDGGLNSDDRVADAITALGRAGVTLINLSFGGASDADHPPVAIGEAIAALPDGVVVVAAAGNFGDRRPTWPAAFDRVTAVGAVDETRLLARGARPPKACFSNWGPWVDAYASGCDVLGPYCTFTETDDDLPRNRIRQDFTGWARWSGTSFAAATVTGRIAKTLADGAADVASARDHVLASGSELSIHGEHRPYVAGAASTWPPIRDPASPAF